MHHRLLRLLCDQAELWMLVEELGWDRVSRLSFLTCWTWWEILCIRCILTTQKTLFVSNKGLNQQRQTCGPKNKSALDGFLKSVNKSRKVINNSNFITKWAGSIDVGSLVLLNSSENTCTLKKTTSKCEVAWVINKQHSNFCRCTVIHKF